MWTEFEGISELDGIQGGGTVDTNDCMGEVLRISRWLICGMASELIDEAGVALAESDLEVTLLSATRMNIGNAKGIDVKGVGLELWQCGI